MRKAHKPPVIFTGVPGDLETFEEHTVYSGNPEKLI